MAVPMYRRAFDATKTVLKEVQEKLQNCVDADGLNPGQRSAQLTIEESKRLLEMIADVLRTQPLVVMAGVLFVYDEEGGDHKPLGNPFMRDIEEAARRAREENRKALKRRNEKMIDRIAARRRKQAVRDVEDREMGFPPPYTPTPT